MTVYRFRLFEGRWALWLATAVLLLMFALSLTSLKGKSPTFDEQGFITRGLGYVRGQNRHMRVGHPLGLNALNASLLAADDGVRLPLDDPSWQKPSFHRPSELFLWENGNDVAHVMFLARLPTIWLGLLLAAFVGRWAWEMTRRRWAGLLALALIAFDPNILAHTRLATTDLGLTAAATLAGFTLWRFLRRPSWGTAVIAGAGFGLLQDTKFTAGLFVPLFALVILVGLAARWREDGRFPAKMLLQLLIAYPLAAFFTLWAAYGFQIGVMPDNLPTLPQLSGLTLPLSHHLEQLLDIGGRLQKGTPAFLLGNYSDSGWWYYFPVAFALKTPLPTLILLIWAITRLRFTLHNSQFTIHNSQLAALLIPALGYFAIALTTDINLGYRHLLPILPFLAVFIANQLTLDNYQLTINNLYFPALLLACLAAVSLWTFPHYLAYFNIFAGGPDGGWRYLADSNLDWGQDLAGLKAWMDENGVEHVWLSYFGEARPDYYGIRYTGLASWPPRLMNPAARPFYPHDPAPGTYAISATNLQGVQFGDHDLFAWFRQRQPIAKIGYSIFVYDVPAYGEPVDLVLNGIQVDEIPPDEFARLGTNDVTLHWVDPETAVLIPGGRQNWQAEDGALYQLPLSAPSAGPPLATFSHGGGSIQLLAADWDENIMPGQTLALVTRWEKRSPPQPVKMFVHLLDENGRFITQWDGLGAAWEGWRSGDILQQTHILAIPGDAPPGTYRIWLGLYHPETGARWQTGSSDRYLLGVVEIGERP